MKAEQQGVELQSSTDLEKAANDSSVTCLIQVKGEKDRKAGPKVTELVQRGWTVQQQLIKLTAERNAINEELLELQGGKKSLLIVGETRVELKQSSPMKIEDLDAVKAALGDRFDDLVKTNITYSLTDKLKDIVASADVPKGLTENKLNKLKGGISSRVSRSITWKAHAPK